MIRPVAPPACSAQLLSHAAVAAAAFALGGLCCRSRGEHAPSVIREPRSSRELEPSPRVSVPTVLSPLPTRSSEVAASSATGHRNKNSRKLFKGEESATKVYCAGTLSDFQGTIPKLVGQDDHVLEIGVSGGGTSALLRLACQNILSIDIERKDWVAAVSEAGGALTLLDAVTDITGLRELSIDPTILYVDLSTILGHDPSFDGIALLRQLGRVFRHSLTKIVVRSRALRAHAVQFLDPHALPEYIADALPLETLHSAPAFRGPSKVYCCVGVTEYRKTISWLVHGDDCVLEIGCQGGITTDLIAKRVRQIRASIDSDQSAGTSDDRVVGVVGVDVAKKSISHARKNFPSTVSKFETCDGWDSARIIELGQQESQCLGNVLEAGTPKNWTVVYVDVSGLSGRAALLDALALVQQLRRCLKPSLRAVVIKSRCLRDFAVGFVDAQLLLEQKKHQKTPQLSTEFVEDSPLPVPPLRRRQSTRPFNSIKPVQAQRQTTDQEEEICKFEVLENGEGEDALPPVSMGIGFAGAATAVVADQKLKRNVGWLSWALGDGGADG